MTWPGTRACLYPPRTPLGAAIPAAQAPQVRIVSAREQALAWIVINGNLRQHDGGTGGFSSCLIIDPGQGRAVALLASSHGCSDDLGRAALLALAGDLPIRAGPQPLWPGWEEDAREVIGALLDGRAAEVHARLIPVLRAQTPAGQLDHAWRRRTAGAGPAGEVAAGRQRISPSGVVAAEVTIAFDRGPLRVRIAFSPSGEIAGLTVLPAPEEPATPDSQA